MTFEAASEPLDRGIHVVSVRGDVDLATAPEFERALGAVPVDGVESVIVDLSDCSFMDSTGLHLLTRTQQRFDSAGGRVAVVSANRGRAQGLWAHGTRRGLPDLSVAGRRLER